MKTITHLSHRMARLVRMDGVLARARTFVPGLHKLIPSHLEYSSGDERLVTRDGVRFALDLSDYMQWHIFANVPEQAWRYACEVGSDNQTVIDVGANAGAFCLKVARFCHSQQKRTRVIALEPNPPMFKRLARNLELNRDIVGEVHLLPFALGATEGAACLVQNDRNSGGVRVEDDGDGVSVQVKTLDSLVADSKVDSIAFIKIDVEGHEPDVLKGAEETIRTYRPRLYVEITDKWFRKRGFSAAQILSTLESWKYRINVDDGNALHPLSTADWQSLPQFNVLCFPVP